MSIKRSPFTAQSLAVPLLLVLTAAVAAADETAPGAHDAHAAHRQMMHAAQMPEPGRESIVIPDAVLTSQNHEQVLLETDVVGDRLVVMDFVYTTCTTVCPVLSAILSQVKDSLGNRLGEEVVLVSLTVDPVRDTPDRLKAYSERFGADDGWLWLTSSKRTMDGVLKELGAYTPNFEDHPSMVLVGDGSTGQWSRFVGFPGANDILSKIDELNAARAVH